MEGIKDHLFKEMIRLLRLPPENRTPRDIATLMEATSEVGFFKQMATDYKTDEVHRECSKCMTLQLFRKGQYIFNYGDAGDSFYIVLRGLISIQLPKSMLSAERTSPSGDDKPPEQDEGARRQLDTEPELPTMIQVKEKGDGTAFGELALLTGQHRTASIQCLEESWIAKLSREDFVRILKGYEERKIVEMVKFLKSLGVFNNWTKLSLIKITYMFETRRYKHSQLVYRSGDSADHVFIIKSGEFKFTYVVEDEVIEGHSRFRRCVPKKHLQMFIKGPTELFGDDDVIKGTARSLTCVCASLEGEVLVIEKNDFLKRLHVPLTWDFLKERHRTEEVWKATRIEKLKRTDGLMKRMTQIQHVASSDRAIGRTSRNGLHKFATENSRLGLESPDISKLTDLQSKAPSFFKTEVDESFYSDEMISPLSTIDQPGLTIDKPKNPLKTGSLPKTPFKIRFASRASKRPPPNFYVNPTEAVRSRYKFRHLITGRVEETMSPLDRSFYRKFVNKRGKSMTDEKRSPMQPIGFG